MSSHVLIRLIRFVLRFTVHFYNAIYFSTKFSIQCKRFKKKLHFAFTTSKHGLCVLRVSMLLAAGLAVRLRLRLRQNCKLLPACPPASCSSRPQIYMHFHSTLIQPHKLVDASEQSHLYFIGTRSTYIYVGGVLE